MDGACPGVSGEVKLMYYPENDPDQTIESEWVKVNDDKNFTTQWKLANLSPGTRYIVNWKRGHNAGTVISDEIEGAFQTPPPVDQESEIDFCIVTCHDYWRKDSSSGS